MIPSAFSLWGSGLMNEELLSSRAREQFLFGWGGYGRNMIFDGAGNAVTVTDSLWIIAFGQNGFGWTDQRVRCVAATSFELLVFLPTFVLVKFKCRDYGSDRGWFSSIRLRQRFKCHV